MDRDHFLHHLEGLRGENDVYAYFVPHLLLRLFIHFFHFLAMRRKQSNILVKKPQAEGNNNNHSANNNNNKGTKEEEDAFAYG